MYSCLSLIFHDIVNCTIKAPPDTTRIRQLLSVYMCSYFAGMTKKFMLRDSVIKSGPVGSLKSRSRKSVTIVEPTKDFIPTGLHANF